MLLPPTPEATKMLSEGKPAVEVAAAFPTFSLAWALLAELALEGDRFIEAYAYARTGYHRGLDALRRNGWKGHGPIPWSHEPNQGFLRCLGGAGPGGRRDRRGGRGAALLDVPGRQQRRGGRAPEAVDRLVGRG